MHGADPGQYQLLVFTGNCDFLGSVGKFKVDFSGDGESPPRPRRRRRSQVLRRPLGSGTGSNDSLIVNL